ncbi:MAG TPA: hypothetical protein VNY33_03315 [Gaiellaceae bacterium]|nr:hypothetical protein [Gaiellaceae bacterium]
MKRFIPLALTVLALAAVPAAFADNGSTPPAAGPAPTAQQGQPDSGQGAANVRARLEALRLRIQLVEQRFAKRCGSSSAKAPQACLDFATKAEDRLTKLDGNLQARIAKIQQTCGTASTDAKCKNADQRIALLQAIDTRVQALAQKVQDWLNGKTVSSTDPSSDSSLDQAAAGLGQQTQQAGGAGK